MLTMKGAVGFYVGWEPHTDEPKVVSRAWFRELAEPWRVGHGLRFRVGSKAFQVGRYHHTSDENPSALSQLGGRELLMTPGQIGAWGMPAPTEVDEGG